MMNPCKLSSLLAILCISHELTIAEIELTGVCNNATGCIGIDPNPDCIEYATCQALLVYSLEQRRIRFVLYATDYTGATDAYYAVGFGMSRLMAKSLVVGCFAVGASATVELSWNTDFYTNKKSVSGSVNINPRVAEVNPRNFLCEFHLPLKFVAEKHTFDLKQPVHILYARGQTSGNKVTYHHPGGRASTTQPLNLYKGQYAVIRLGDIQELEAVQVHTIIMITSFIFLIPLGILVARFFKECLINRKIIDFKIWVILHASFMSMAVLGSVFSLLWIGSSSIGGYRIKRTTAIVHYVLGTVVVILLIANWLLGLLLSREMLGLLLPRPIIHKVHTWLGYTVAFLSWIQLFLVVSTMPYYLSSCSPVELLLIFWFIAYGGVFLGLTFIIFKGDKKLEKMYMETPLSSVIPQLDNIPAQSKFSSADHSNFHVHGLEPVSITKVPENLPTNQVAPETTDDDRKVSAFSKTSSRKSKQSVSGEGKKKKKPKKKTETKQTSQSAVIPAELDDDLEFAGIKPSQFRRPSASPRLTDLTLKNYVVPTNNQRAFREFPLIAIPFRENPFTGKILIILAVFAGLSVMVVALLVFLVIAANGNKGCKKAPVGKFNFNILGQW